LLIPKQYGINISVKPLKKSSISSIKD
jgi:hypothetical protein